MSSYACHWCKDEQEERIFGRFYRYPGRHTNFETRQNIPDPIGRCQLSLEEFALLRQELEGRVEFIEDQPEQTAGLGAGPKP